MYYDYYDENKELKNIVNNLGKLIEQAKNTLTQCDYVYTTLLAQMRTMSSRSHQEMPQPTIKFASQCDNCPHKYNTMQYNNTYPAVPNNQNKCCYTHGPIIIGPANEV